MIRRWFGSMHSFADKVSLLITLTSGVAIIAVSFTLAATDYFNLRRETLASLESQTMIVAMNSSAPLAFTDRNNALEALAAFRTRDAVALASLYDATGAPFVSYRRTDGEVPQSAHALLWSLFGSGWRRQSVPITQKGQKLGRLEVVYDLRGLQHHLLRSLALSTLVAMVAVVLVFLFSLRIRRNLTRPIALLGETARKVSQTRDYTQRAPKVSQDELGTFTDTFNQMLEQIHKQDLEIQASRAEALRANRLKDEFLATLSHELRTPMAPIVGWAQILRLTAGDNPKVRQAAEVIERNARAQNKIIDDLLEMSRIVSGKIKLDIRRIDLADVIAEAVDVVAPSAAAKTIALENGAQRGVAMVRGDPHRLQQVVWNLLSNAIKFTSAGGRVAIALHERNGFAEMSVGDSGQGIPAEFLPHVFERFRQADSTNTRQHSGLGLGLAIVRQLVELHGGSVAAASDGENRGATFTVVLPLAAATPDAPSEPDVRSAPANAPAADASPLRGLRILLVEDDRDAREVIEQVLEIAGASVLACASAGDALAAFDAFEPSLLVSDIAMPGKSGYDLIRDLRDSPSPARHDVPAIALTAFARPDDRARAIEAGFQQHLSKPIDNDTLIAAVAAVAVEARRAPASAAATTLR